MMIPTIKKARSGLVTDDQIDLKESAQDLSLQESSDEALMQAYAKNDQLAFNVLYERYRLSLYRYMFKQTSMPEAVLNELYQDVWLKLINSRSQYQVKASFKTFLYQIANNTLKDYYRRESVRSIMSNLEDDTQIQDKAKLPDDRLQENELMEKFRQALNELPQDQRDVFLLREEAGLTSVQIAEVMQVSLDTVKSRMRYAVSRLKEIID
ncbi:MAG: sigma-70 family RNA polymerase sigma factor [Gammaproteobacteria bacterium]|nr:sigma-70 family RNA polymerase sigma factor [Gammaproteobacteria bacterium]